MLLQHLPGYAGCRGPEYHTRQPSVSSVMQTQRLLRVALWSILLAAATYTSTDPDLWGNVRFGLDILRDASIPHVDPYSFTADHAWINHEWLSEVITAGAFRLGGNPGLILLKLATIGGMLLLLNSTLRREGVDAAIVRDGATARRRHPHDGANTAHSAAAVFARVLRCASLVPHGGAARRAPMASDPAAALCGLGESARRLAGRRRRARALDARGRRQR